MIPKMSTNLSTLDLRYWLALWRMPGIGPIKFATILQAFSKLEDFFSITPNQRKKLGLAEELQPDWHDVEQDLLWLQASPLHHIITIEDSRYPTLLKQIPDPPPLLFIKGNPHILSEPQLAIVGSRNPTINGLEIAKDFAAYLAKSGLVITSGFATGIDATSHQGALKSDGKTIAVMGTGLDRIYPKKHQNLAQEIVDQEGVLVCEFPIGTPVRAENFPQRNRIISGLSLGTLVVEAALQSGSLITARIANEQGREVFAIPGSIHNPLARGCHFLIKQGAKLVETAADILEELGTFVSAANPSHTKVQNLVSLPKLDPDHLKLLKCIGFESTSVDVLVQRSGFPVKIVSSMLLILELENYIAATPSGYMRVKP
jgi:DNA processing protein